MKSIILILASVIANTLPRWLPGVDGNKFCQYQALSFVLMAFAGICAQNKYSKIVWQGIAGLACNNLYDEVLGDPLKTGFIEITFAILITFVTILRLIKCKTMKY